MSERKESPRHGILRDARPALGLFAVGAFFFLPVVFDSSSADLGMMGILIGFALMPLAAVAAVALLPMPKNLFIRSLLALSAGATTVALMMASLRR